jgi:hypothetical protein
VSGITLDAISLGAPVITTAGTWMGRLVERFRAGLTVEDFSPPALQAAVDKVRNQYDAYAGRARDGGETLRTENSGRHLMEIFTEETGLSLAPARGKRGGAPHSPG